MKTGFIGLGIMGRPMAKNLLKAGFDLMVADLSREAVEDLVKAGAREGTYAQIGEQCGVVIIMVPSGAITQSILFDEGGAASALRPGSIVCDMSSVMPMESRLCYERLKELGVGFLDAPVSGGETGAVDGTLAIMAGGDRKDFDAMKEYFDVLGSSALLIGESGSGSVAKLANQIIVNNTIAVVSEALVFAVKAGVDPQKVYEAIRGGLAGSAVLDAKAPMMIERNFRPGGPIRINHKDIKNVVETAHQLDVPIPYSAQLYEILQTLKIHGHMNDDHAGIVQYFEGLAGVTVKKNVLSSDELLRREIEADDKKIVVLDDDPTGVQTVHDISVYTNWEKDSIRDGFLNKDKLFYILTNSRGLTQAQTRAAHEEIAQAVDEVAKELGRDYLFISRSDSTLRGHYPLETEVLRENYEKNTGRTIDGEVLCPFFREGGRLTIDNVHYVREGDRLIPANETEFARDKTFGYKAASLPEYVEEKTEGRYRAADVVCISLDDIRAGNIDGIEKQLLSVRGFNKVIVNACEDDDVRIFCVALYRAMAKGKTFMFRTAASIVKIMGGITDIPLLTKRQMIARDTGRGGIVVVGSHTRKTTGQLEALKTLPSVEFVELDASLVRDEQALEAEVARCLEAEERCIRAGKTVCCYTTRSLITADTGDKEDELRLSVRISEAVQSLVGRLNVTPAYVVAKGGITSSDIGIRALGVRRANVLGQIRPGIPVWQTGPESRFPSIPYVIFPGNVGDTETLRDVVEMLG